MPMDDKTARRINEMFARLPRGPWRKVKVMTREAQVRKIVGGYFDESAGDPDPADAYNVLLKISDALGDDDDECHHGALDPDRTCIGCGSTEHERSLDALNEQQTPIPPDQPDMIEDVIEALAVELLDRTRRNVETEILSYDLSRALAKLIRAGRSFDVVMQTFAGFVTEHTMGIIAEGGPRGGDVQARVKLQDSRGALLERNSSEAERDDN